MVTELQEKLIMLYVLDKLGTSLTSDSLLELSWKVHELPPMVAHTRIDELKNDGYIENKKLLGIDNLFLTDKGKRHLSVLIHDEIPRGKLTELDAIVKGIINGESEIYRVDNSISPIDEESYYVECKFMVNDIENISIKLRAKDLYQANDFLRFFEENANKLKDKIIKEEDI